MESGDPLKHRLNLWIKSEEAMGVPSVRRIEFPETPAALGEKTQPPVTAARPPQATEPRPAQSAGARAAIAARIEAPLTSMTASSNTLLPLLETPFSGPVLGRDEKIRLLNELDVSAVKNCTRCGLHSTRSQTVFGEGDPDGQICFIGEGPGKDEDASGRPFVGRAGQKLTEMIGAMGLKREQVYICNIVKCRAYLTDVSKDRPPTDEETAACTPYLLRQMEIIRPKVIVTLGLPSTRYLLKSKASMTSMRGKWHLWRGIKVMPTWHPAYVLRNYTQQTRSEVWEDLKKVLVEIGLPIPKRSGKQE